MLTQQAKVVRIINPETAEVEIKIGPISGHDCCGATNSATSVIMKANNLINAQKDDHVLVETPSAGNMLLTVLIAFIPIILLLVGYSIWAPWGGFASLLGVAISWVLLQKTAKARAARIISKLNN